VQTIITDMEENSTEQLISMFQTSGYSQHITTHLLMLFTQLLLTLYTEHYSFCSIFTNSTWNGQSFGWRSVFYWITKLGYR